MNNRTFERSNYRTLFLGAALYPESRPKGKTEEEATREMTPERLAQLLARRRGR